MSLILNKEIGGINFDVSFKDKVCVLMGFSGTGKTFLLKTLKTCLDTKGLRCIYVDPSNLNELGMTEKDLKSIISRGVQVVLFDNASFYLTDTLFNAAVENSDFVLISTNYLNDTDLGPVGYYDIDFSGDTLKVMRETYA